MGEYLTLVTENYSGCGVDIARCQVCNNYFQISYKIDKVINVTEDINKHQKYIEEFNAR